MSRNIWIFVLVVLALVGGVVGLFWFQNQFRMTGLSLDLGVAAWQLKDDVPVPALMAICLGAGALVPSVWLGLRLSQANRRARSLEQELALSRGTGDDGWRS